MDQSRESLQTRIQALKDPSVRELVRDVVDSAWQWSRGQVGKQAQERWVIVGGQAVRGTTENEKAPPQNGGQSDGQGQTHPITGGPAGPAGPAGPIGPAGPQGDVGPAGPTIGHDLLPGLNDGDYQHLTALQLADLTDGGDSVAHFHSSDRDRANHTGTQMASTISDFAATADGRIALQKGAASGLAPLDSGSKVPLSYLPATTIVETSVVASQAAMLALTAQQGDVAVRTDLSKTFILKADPASILGNWQEMLSPTDGVQSVGLSAPALMTSGGGPVTNTGTLSLAWNGPSSDIVRADGSVVSGTTNFGRSLLTLADAAAARTAIGAQAAGSYEPAIAGTSSSMFWRGDKAWTNALYAQFYSVGSTSGFQSFNGGAVAEWYMGQNGTTQHGWLLNKVASGVHTTYLTMSTSGVATFVNRPVFGVATPWDSGNLTGDRSEHYHSSDRSRSNHTGTQLAVTISDLGAAVSALCLPLAGGALNNGANITSIRGLYFDQSPDYGRAEIIKGNGDGATQATQTLKIRSWNGIGFDDLFGGVTRTWFNIRSGNNYTTGNWYSDTNKAVWHSGNLTGTRNEHNHSGLYQPAGSYQPLEDQRLSSTDEVAFARVRSSSILPVDAGGADEIGGSTDMWTSAHLKTVRTNRVLVAFGGTPSVAFNSSNYLEMTSINGVCGYLVGRQGGVQTFDLGGQYGNLRLASSVGVFGQYGPAGKPKVTGAKGGNVALTSLISALVEYGFIEDLST